MKAIVQGIAVVLTTLFLFTLSVRAGTVSDLNSVMKGKSLVYQGTCHLGTDGLFSKGTGDYTVHRCDIYADMREEGDIYYAIILSNQSVPMKLIYVDKDKDVQRVIWRRGAEV